MWYKELGFSYYPLDPRSNEQLVGVDDLQKSIEEYILQGNMCLVCGFTGSGKTSILKKIMKSKKLKQFKFVYVSADGIKKDHDIEDVLWDVSGIVEKVLRKKPRNVVILLDECHLASRILTESIKSKWNVVYKDGSKAIQSVVVSQIDDRLHTNFSGSFADRLGKRVVRMPKLDGDSLKKVLSIRLNNGKKNYISVFDEEALDFLVENADGSVRQILEYADAIFRYHHDIVDGNPLLSDEYKISKEAVFNILQAADLVSNDRFAKKESFQKIFSSSRLMQAVEMFKQFGTMSAVDLAEKLDVTHDSSKKIIKELKSLGAVMFAHADDGREYFVLSPRLQHELTSA